MRKMQRIIASVTFSVTLLLLLGFTFFPFDLERSFSEHTKKSAFHLQKKTMKDSPLALSVNEPIHLVFAGDIIIYGSTVQAIERFGIDYPFVHVAGEVQSADYAIANLETAVTTRNMVFPKSFNFKMPPHYLMSLKNAGFDMVTLANNHTLDYTETGLIDTLNYLTEHGIQYFGAGRNEQEAYRANTIELKGKTIAFLGFSHVLPAVSWYAQETKPGIASGYQFDRIERRIREEKEKADYVIVYIHWGEELKQSPEPYQRSYGRAMIDAGADAVIGSHPHVLQPIEQYKGRPIVHSLGNFLFPNHVKGPTAETGLFHLYLNGDEVTYEFTKYKIENDQIVPR